MTDPSGLFGEFCDALNAELSGLECGLRIARDRPGPGATMLLLKPDGVELGWLPDYVDAPSIAAFEQILGGRGN